MAAARTKTAAKRTLDSAFPSSSSTGEPATKKLASIFAPKQSGMDNKTYEWLAKKDHKKGFCHFRSMDPTPSSKIAGFDIDGCLIKPKGDNKWPKDEHDWKWLYPSIPAKLRSLHQQGFTILFISNQAGAPAHQQKFEKKLPLMANNLMIPLTAFAAFEYDEYRKPSPGIWRYFTRHQNGGLQVDYTQSFYVGDAAGRKSDHSDTDRKMAENCGLKFFTPEEFFLSQSPDPNWSYSSNSFNPTKFDHTTPLFTPTSLPLVLRTPDEFSPPPTEVILFVGYPASGKTSFYKKWFQPAGYVHVNQDTLKTRAACLSLVTTSLSLTPPRSCVVDNTNPQSETRNLYIDLIKKNFPNVKIRCFWFTASKELAMHNSVYRKVFKEDLWREVLPKAAFENFEKGVKKPKKDEGFDEVKEISFKFDGTEEELKDWNKWLDVYPKGGWGKKK